MSRKNRKPNANPIAKRKAEIVQPDQVGKPTELKIRGVYHESYHGLLPRPDHLEHYERLSPGITEFLKDRLESQESHRQLMEAMVVKSQLQKDKQAPWVGVFALFIVCSLAAFLGFLGNSGGSIGLAIAAIAAVMGSSVLSARREQQELDRGTGQSDRGELPEGKADDDDLEI